MKQNLILVLVTTLFLVGNGCKKDDGGSNAPPPSGATVTEQEPNDATPQALGTLGTTDVVVSGSTSSANDIDRYSIALASTANLFVKDSALVGATVSLSIQNNNSVNLTSRSGNSPQSCTLTNRAAGSYIIHVSSSNTAATAYAIRIGVR